MGCSASKSIQTANAPGTAPDNQTASASSGQSAKNRIAVKAVEPVPSKSERGNSAKSTDSGLADDDDDDGDAPTIITEATDGGEAVAGQGMLNDADFSLAGVGYQSRSRASLFRQDIGSAVSTKSAPSALSPETDRDSTTPTVTERPKSRGGLAFEMQWDEPKTVRRPARLKALQNRGRVHRDQTLAELQGKLQAAERRRAEYARRIKQKMADESDKVDRGSRSLQREKTTLGTSIVTNEDKAAANRERHLKQLRDKLKAKEERAKRVRANKIRLSQQQDRLTQPL